MKTLSCDICQRALDVESYPPEYVIMAPEVGTKRRPIKLWVSIPKDPWEDTEICANCLRVIEGTLTSTIINLRDGRN